MTRINQAILFSAIATSAHAWSYYQGVSYGLSYPRNTQQQAVFTEASLNPNATTSVPVALGGQNFTLRINITDLAVSGVDTPIADPRAVLTAYDVTWMGGSSFDDTFENPGPSCFTTTNAPFPNSVTDKASIDGDCTKAFGDDCVNALKGTSSSCNSTFFVPSDCQDAFKSVDQFFGYTLGDDNASDSLSIYAYDSAIMSASDSKNQYDTAAGQMYFALFRDGQEAAVPVCARVSSASAILKAGSSVWTFGIAGLVAVWAIS